MGIHVNMAVLLKDWIERHSLVGPVLTLGVQTIPYSAAVLREVLRIPGVLSNDASVTASALFAALGLGETTTLDVSGYEGAQVLFDLNSDALPADQRHRYGFVFNGGTLEHVFHVPNALENMTELLTPGGSIAHVLPLNNWVDHGFYQFSPTLAYDYYSAAGFELLESAVAAFQPRRDGGSTWEVIAAPPGIFGNGSPGALDDRSYFLLVLVRATGSVAKRPLPTQTMYAHMGTNAVKPPRWFSTYELRFGTRVDRPNRSITPLRRFACDEGKGWICQLPELRHWSDGPDNPARSRLVILEDDRPLGPAHATHQSIRQVGGGAYSHWGEAVYLSIPDGSDPNTNGRTYLAVLPGNDS